MTIQAKIKRLIKKREGVAKTMPKLKAVRQKLEPNHNHLWKIIGKSYGPPTNLNVSNSNVPGEILEKALFGVTTFLWECVCGETKREELLGSDEDLLESLINKADKIGPQFVERRGKSYILSEWKPQTQNPNMLPLK